MVTAPTVPNLQVDNFKVNDRREAVIKDNSRNKKMEVFATQLAKMCDELNTEFQYVEDTRIDITNKSGQVAADRQAVTAAKNAVNADRQHVDQQTQAIDTTAEQVSQNAQQVATDRGVVAKDKQSAANAAQAASSSAGDALTAKQQAEALYGDLDAVNTAKTQSQQAATTASQQRALAVTARQGAEQALADALQAAAAANVDIDAAIAALVDSSPEALNTLNELAAALGDDPNFATTVNNTLAGKLSKSGGVLTGKASIEKTDIDTAEFELKGMRSGAGGAVTRIALSNNQDGSQGFVDTWVRANGKIDLELSGFRKLLATMAVDFTSGLSVRNNGFVNIDLYSFDRTGEANIGGIRFWDGSNSKAGELLFTADGQIKAANGGRIVGVDADKLDGAIASYNEDPYTIARRNDKGDIKARLFRSSYTDLNSSVEVIYTAQNNDGNDYIRPSTPSQVKAAMGLDNVDNVQAPRGDWIDTVGLASQNPFRPYLRRRSDGQMTYLANADGNYANLRARGTTKDDVGLGKVSNIAASEKADSATIAARNDSGDIWARLFRSTYTGLNSNIAVIYTAQNNDGTDYMRPSSPGQVKVAMGLSNVANVDQRNASNLTSGTVPAARINRTASRSDNATDKFLVARSMVNHCNSGDHDERYYTKSQVDSVVSSSAATEFSAIGAYGIFRGWSGDSFNAQRGQVFAGSQLRWSTPDGNAHAEASATPPGSWQLRSHSFSSVSRVGLFMRVA